MKLAWKRVNRAERCPICNRPDWCLVSEDGTVAICPRVQSDRQAGEAGWVHRLNGTQDMRGSQSRLIAIKHGATNGIDFAGLAQQFSQALDAGRLHQLAGSLGLSEASLLTLGVGWSGGHRAWTFPMHDASGLVIGIRLRLDNGRKLAVRGSRVGLFLPQGQDSEARLLVAEGESDAAALLTIGYRNVVGRPGCQAGTKLLVELVKQRCPNQVVIVSDGDGPGIRGADDLAEVLAGYVSDVRVIQPTSVVKDMRQWVRAGATIQQVEQVIGVVEPRKLPIKVIRKETSWRNRRMGCTSNTPQLGIRQG